MAIYRSYRFAGRLASEGMKSLPKADRESFAANPAFFLAPDGKRMPDLTGNVDSHFALIERARRVVFEHVFLAADTLAFAIQSYVDATGAVAPETFLRDQSGKDESLTFRAGSEEGLLRIGGFGNDSYTDDTSFLIDLGGDDSYANNAGGCRREGAVSRSASIMGKRHLRGRWPTGSVCTRIRLPRHGHSG